MSHFTQLNLQGNSGNKPTPTKPDPPTGLGGKTNRPAKKQHGTAKTVAAVGSCVAAALAATLTLGTYGCSKTSKSESKTASVTAPSLPQSATIPTTPMTSSAIPAAPKKPAKKKIARQSTISTYKNSDYGISFRYPKHYSLVKDEDATLEWAGLGPVQMNFIQPGGTTISAVQLPDGMYPGTDFASAFFNVSVNSKLTAAECAQFAFANPPKTAADSSENETGNAELDATKDDKAAPSEPVIMKMGASEYTEVESSGGDSGKHASAKYYHVFQNAACYEFALGLQTAEANVPDGTQAVDQEAVFRKLNWMLSTVKIQPAGVPDKSIPAVASATKDEKATEESTDKTDTTTVVQATPEKGRN